MYWQAFDYNTINGNGEEGIDVPDFRTCVNLCSTTATCIYASLEEPSQCFLLNSTDTQDPNTPAGGTYTGYDRATLQTS